MAGRKRIQTFKRDNAIVDIIKNHVGVNNAIKSTELVKELSFLGYCEKKESIHTIMSKIIKERNLPIASSTKYGYWWRNSKEDFVIAIEELRSKARELYERIDHLSKFIIE